MKLVSKNIKETRDISRIFLRKILKDKKGKSALVVALSGDLGTGKTAFTKEAAKHLKIRSRISSPTFVIMKKHPLKLKGYKFFFHLDAYRLKNEKELLYLGWKEIVSNKEHLVFIEWPENVSGAIPKQAKRLKISINKQGNRNFNF